MKKNKVFSLIDKAVFDFSLLEDGDSILIGASGGKDSTILAEYLSQRKKQRRENFSLAALHIGTDISPPLSEEIKALYKDWGIALHIQDFSVLDRVREGKKMNCWWCSTQRRTALNNFALEGSFNKIALGHHLDDVLETLLMNAVNKAELSTMIPKLSYEKYPVTIIRPLYYVDEKSIILRAKKEGFASFTCSCDYQAFSERKNMREKLRVLTDGSFDAKMRLLSSLQNIKTDYLPQKTKV